MGKRVNCHPLLAGGFRAAKRMNILLIILACLVGILTAEAIFTLTEKIATWIVKKIKTQHSTFDK